MNDPGPASSIFSYPVGSWMQLFLFPLHETIRELQQTTAGPSCRTAPNNSINEAHNDTARAKCNLVSFFAIHCKTTGTLSNDEAVNDSEKYEFGFTR